MITRFRVAIVISVAVGLSLATLDARQGQQTAAAGAPEVFCNTMQAGALCLTATVSILKLSGPKFSSGSTLSASTTPRC